MDGIAIVGVVGIGLAWRRIQWLPAAEHVRRVVAAAVFTIFLPALTFHSMAHAPLGSVLWKVPLVATLSMTLTLLGAWFFLRRKMLDRRRQASLLLASAFGNVTYLGIPVLTMAVGAEHTFVAVLYDFAASTPLLWTVGVGVALAMTAGNAHAAGVWRRLLLLPPLWAAGAGLAVQFWEVPLPLLLEQVLAGMGALVVPLMMFVLGLSLRWEYLRHWRELVGVGVFKLFVAPAVAILVAAGLGLEGRTACATVLEAGMPTMMLVLVVAERFGLDSDAVAAAIALTTLASMVTLPLWWAVASILA